MSMNSRRYVEGELRHDPLTALYLKIAHGLSEASDDVDLIMPTVSAWDVNFSLLEQAPGGGHSRLRDRARRMDWRPNL